MKKILSLALAAIVASTVCGAQSLSTKPTGKPMTKKVIPAMANQRINTQAPKAADMSMASRTVAGSSSVKASKSVSADRKSTLAPVIRGKAAATRKAPTMLEKYVGYGYSYGDKKNLKWNMTPGTIETEEGDVVDVLYDIIPVPEMFKENGVETVPVKYTYNEEDNTIVVPAQPVLTRSYEDGSVSYMLVFSELEEDGSIIINIGANGSLTVNENDVLTYGDWDTTEIAYDDDDNYEGYNGYYVRMQQVQYFKPGDEPVYVPQPEYEPEGLFLHASISPSAYGYQNNLQFMPAYTKQSFKNFTTDDADAWSWKMARQQVNAAQDGYEDAETFTATTMDFSINTVDAVYSPAELTASYEGHAGAPYIWGLSHEEGKDVKAFIYASFMGENYEMSDGTFAIVSKCDPSNSFSVYSSMGTPDVNSRKDTLTSLILYQGKPESAFYFEGVNFLVWDLKTEDDFTLKCKVQKVTRDPETGRITLGDVIAEADAIADDIIQGYQDNGWNLWQINWKEFYTLDEFGFSETLDYVMVDEEFALVFEGWDNGTFSCSPMGESDSNSNGVQTIFCKLPNDENVYRYGYVSHLYAGFNNAVYGYLHTEDATDFQFGKDGGAGTMHILPMLYSVSTDEESGEKVPSPRLFIESVTIDGEAFEYEFDDETGEDNLPEWLGVGFNNFNKEMDGDYPVSIEYDLIVAVDELTDADSRDVDIVFMQEGARLKVTIHQGEDQPGVKGDVNGDGAVDVADISNVITVMAAGEYSAAADVNGDGAVDVADISNIITIMAGN